MAQRFLLLTSVELRAELQSSRPPALVDIRSRDAYEAGHVPGSIHVPVYDLGARRGELPANVAVRVVVIGDHRKRAHAAGTFLTLIGFGDVALLAGGIAAYDGPIEVGPPPAPPRSGPQLRVVPSDGGD